MCQPMVSESAVRVPQCAPESHVQTGLMKPWSLRNFSFPFKANPSFRTSSHAYVFRLMVVLTFLALPGGCARKPPCTADQAKKFLDSGEPVKAVGILDQLISKNPSDVHLLLLRGQGRQRIDACELAISDYSAVIKIKPELSAGWEARGRLLSRNGDYDDALSDLNHAAKLASHPASILSAIGLVYFYRENYKEAREYFDKSTSIDSGCEAGYFGRTAISLEEKDYPSAIAEMERLLNIQPKNASALFRRGFAYLKASEPAKALDDFNRALSLDPDMKQIYWYRADAHRALNDLDQALDDYDKAAATDPKDPIIFLNQATILMMLGRAPEALEKLGRSIVLEPDNPLPYINRSASVPWVWGIISRP